MFLDFGLVLGGKYYGLNWIELVGGFDFIKEIGNLDCLCMIYLKLWVYRNLKYFWKLFRLGFWFYYYKNRGLDFNYLFMVLLFENYGFGFGFGFLDFSFGLFCILGFVFW